MLKSCAVAVWASALASTSWAGIYSCTDKQGRRLTSDRPIAECVAKEQQVLNRDGSVKTVIPPTLTAEEKSAKESRERAANEARMAEQDAIRRDRNLLTRYPDEAAHLRARESALDSVRLAIKTSEARLRDLAQQRKPLLSETEFYQGKPMPAKLKSALDANDAAIEAQKSATQSQTAELARINRLYDTELARLRRLWGGALPGSLGPTEPSMVLTPASASPAKPPR